MTDYLQDIDFYRLSKRAPGLLGSYKDVAGFGREEQRQKKVTETEMDGSSVIRGVSRRGILKAGSSAAGFLARGSAACGRGAAGQGPPNQVRGRVPRYREAPYGSYRSGWKRAVKDRRLHLSACVMFARYSSTSRSAHYGRTAGAILRRASPMGFSIFQHIAAEMATDLLPTHVGRSAGDCEPHRNHSQARFTMRPANAFGLADPSRSPVIGGLPPAPLHFEPFLLTQILLGTVDPFRGP
jgi:hypothetical protein